MVRLQGVLQASLGPARGPQARRLINLDKVEKWFARAFYKGIRPAACAIAINSPGALAALLGGRVMGQALAQRCRARRAQLLLTRPGSPITTPSPDAP